MSGHGHTSKSSRSARSARPSRSPRPSIGWSHQNDLSRAVGQNVRIGVLVGNTTDPCEGKLLAADQFTIKVLTTHGDRSAEVVFFKHALVYFSVVK